jgi:LPS-assembly lipoprotein
MTTMRRRSLIRLCGCAAVGVALSGCGFQLRRTPPLPFGSIYLTGFSPLSPMADELRRQLRLSPGLRISESAPEAEVVLMALADAQDQVVVASTTAGQVRELTVRARLRFRVRSRAGQELIPETELSLSRDMSFSETASLAKESEKTLILGTLQQDIARQVMRRLAALPPLR